MGKQTRSLVPDVAQYYRAEAGVQHDSESEIITALENSEYFSHLTNLPSLLLKWTFRLFVGLFTVFFCIILVKLEFFCFFV